MLEAVILGASGVIAVVFGSAFWLVDRMQKRDLAEDHRFEALERDEQQAKERAAREANAPPPTIEGYVIPGLSVPCPRCGLKSQGYDDDDEPQGGNRTIKRGWGITKCDCVLKTPHVHASCAVCGNDWLMAPARAAPK